MSRLAREYLQDMLDHVLLIEDFTRDGRAVFMADRKTQFAVIRAYEVIGEITKRLPDELLQTQPQIEWQEIKDFRNFLAHNYERIKLAIVWGAVEKLPMLKQAVEMILQEMNDDSNSSNEGSLR